MTSDKETEEQLRAKLNAETSRIAWKELQRFFASGCAISVDANLDLIDVAYLFNQDDSEHFQQWISAGKVQKVSDKQAQDWFDRDVMVWAVVLAPWVLIQYQADAFARSAKAVSTD